MSKVYQFNPWLTKKIRHITTLIKGTRAVKEINQEQVAKSIGMSRPQYTAMENNIGRMRVEDFLTVLEELGLEFDIHET